MRRKMWFGAAVALCLVEHKADALIYLADGSLESMLVRCPVVLIGNVTGTDTDNDRATVQVTKSLKGELKGELTVKGFLLRVSAKEKKPRFAKGDRVILFMGQDEKTGTVSIVKSQVLADETEAKAMEGCVAEVMPVAQALAVLANPKKEVDAPAVKAAVTTLVKSDNEYTKILVGRLMGTSLTDRIKPEGWDDVVLAGLKSKRKELRKGALVWAGKYVVLPTEVKTVVQDVANDKGDATLAEEATKLLEDRHTSARRPKG